MAGMHRTRAPWVKLAVAAGVLSVGAFGVGAVLASAEPEVKAGVSASATVSTPSSSAPRTVQVTLAEKNNSGVSGKATVTGSTVVATADGLDPDHRYYSFVYGVGSSSSSSNPCILTGERAAGPVDTVVGRWKVDDDGHGTLEGRIALAVLEPGTLSIREDDLGTNGAAGPTPADKLVACGQIGPRRTTAAGQVQDQLPPVKVSTPAIVPITR